MTSTLIVFLNLWWGAVLLIAIFIYCDTLYHRTSYHTEVFRDDTPCPDMDDPDGDGTTIFSAEDDDAEELDVAALAAEERRIA